jgi:hypothetical protein
MLAGHPSILLGERMTAGKERSPDNPWWNPAIGCELTPRERRALMSEKDWDEVVTIIMKEENNQKE